MNCVTVIPRIIKSSLLFHCNRVHQTSSPGAEAGEEEEGESGPAGRYEESCEQEFVPPSKTVTPRRKVRRKSSSGEKEKSVVVR